MQKYKSQNWQALVANPNAKASVDVECLVEGNDNCGPGVVGAQTEVPVVTEPVATVEQPQAVASGKSTTKKSNILIPIPRPNPRRPLPVVQQEVAATPPPATEAKPVVVKTAETKPALAVKKSKKVAAKAAPIPRWNPKLLKTAAGKKQKVAGMSVVFWRDVPRNGARK